MLIPPTSSAAQAASVVSQATAKDASTEAARAVGQTVAKQSAVEQTNSTSADRDAQGQGDGLPGEQRQAIVDELEVDGCQTGEASDANHAPAPTLPGEAPSQLDITG